MNRFTYRAYYIQIITRWNFKIWSSWYIGSRSGVNISESWSSHKRFRVSPSLKKRCQMIWNSKEIFQGKGEIWRFWKIRNTDAHFGSFPWNNIKRSHKPEVWVGGRLRCWKAPPGVQGQKTIYDFLLLGGRKMYIPKTREKRKNFRTSQWMNKISN